MIINKSFTIFIPVFNGEKTIHKTILSIIEQTEKNIDIYVLDNGSTDSTHKIVEMCDDNRIHYLKYEHTSSLGDSLNRVFNIEIQTDYFSICHADDIYHPNYVKEMIASFERHRDADILFCPALLINSEGTKKCSIYNTFKTICVRLFPKYDGAIGVARLLIWNNLIAPSAAFRRSAISSFPMFAPNLIYFTDVYFWTKFLSRGGVIRATKKPLIYYRVHFAQMSTVSRQLENQLIEIDALAKSLNEENLVKPTLIKVCVTVTKYLRCLSKLVR